MKLALAYIGLFQHNENVKTVLSVGWLAGRHSLRELCRLPRMPKTH